MRSTARQPAEEPAPAQESLEDRAGAALDEHRAVFAEIRAVHAEIRDMIRALPAAACDQKLAVMLARALGETAERQRQLLVMSDANSLHLEEARGAMADYTVTREADAHIYSRGYEDGQARERERAAKAAIPGPRHRRGYAAREPGEGQRALFSVKALVPVAAAFWAARKAIPAHVKLAAFTTTVLAGAGGAAFVVAPAVTHSAPGPVPGSAASLPGWHTSASPFPSSSQIALTLTKPKPKHAAKGKELLSTSGVPAPAAGPQTGSAPSASPSSPPVVSAQAGPATLSVSAASLDLSGPITSATVTISASGGGFASWHIDTTGTDLVFSQENGVLQANQSVTVTVSLASALDGLSRQAFAITTSQGVVVSQVLVSLPLPLPAVSVAPSPVASLVPSIAPGL